jgi:hypothetical protein
MGKVIGASPAFAKSKTGTRANLPLAALPAEIKHSSAIRMSSVPRFRKTSRMRLDDRDASPCRLQRLLSLLRYDLNVPGQHYDKAITEVSRTPNIKILKSSWLVESNESPTDRIVRRRCRLNGVQ